MYVSHLFTVVLLLAGITLASTKPIDPSVVFEERDGTVAVEAEHFASQEKTDKRAWHITTKQSEPGIKPDGDPSHAKSASGGAYIEILPDTRRTHDDKLINGENFTNKPGHMAVLTYNIYFNNPGRYYCWVRTHATGTEDNGIHLGLNGKWPESGARIQWTKKNEWKWDTKQRTTKVHSGVFGKIWIDIPSAGLHKIHFSMREDGFEFDKFILTQEVPNQKSPPKNDGPKSNIKKGKITQEQPTIKHGSGKVIISGANTQWQPVTLTLDGPHASELDKETNPFLDHALWVTFTHSSGSPQYRVPGYFAADGNAAETSAKSGNQWRTHFSPDKPGEWSYQTVFFTDEKIALLTQKELSNRLIKALKKYRASGKITIKPTPSDASGFYSEGRLTYVGKPYLQFAGSKRYFLKAGADAPETLLAYTDFDDTISTKKKGPLKSYKPHLKDWRNGDPTWKNGKGKGLIGALNYLSGKGMNAFSFLPYNAGGDGDNVWPFVSRNEKFHYDCSKLDQWNIIFTHAQSKGLYLHFKLQETENDDKVPTSLDSGNLGPERKLYCREIIARYGHHLALNWNLGEENTQTTKQQKDMANYIRELDPYNHNLVIHTYPNQQDKIYKSLLGFKPLTGTSLQNSNFKDVHWQTVKWHRASVTAKHPWAVAFDEPGDASFGTPPDPDYTGMPKSHKGPSIDEARKWVLWGNLLGGGCGVEYYFGYKLPENDLLCEDWRSRDKSWEYARIALDFFHEQKIPFWEMSPNDEAVGNPKSQNTTYCLSGNNIYLLSFPDGGQCELTLPAGKTPTTIQWFNPRNGKIAKPTPFNGGKITCRDKSDWVAIVRTK